MADEIVIRGADELVAKLGTFKGLTRLSGFNGQRWMRKACLRVISNVKTKRFAHRSGPPLPDRLTSRHGGAGLQGSIHESIEVQGNTLIGRIGTKLPYGAIHELGGSIAKRFRGTRKGKAYGSRMGAFREFTSAASGTGSFVMPKRPYLKPALEAEEPNIRRDFDNEIKKAIGQAGLK